jgi:hypothetical protein
MHSCCLVTTLKDGVSVLMPLPRWLLLTTELSVIVKVTLRLMVSQSVSLGVKPHLVLMTRYLLLFDSYGLVFVGLPL